MFKISINKTCEQNIATDDVLTRGQHSAQAGAGTVPIIKPHQGRPPLPSAFAKHFVPPAADSGRRQPPPGDHGHHEGGGAEGGCRYAAVETLRATLEGDGG